MNRATDVVELARAQIKQASEVHARAFHDSPLSVWNFPDEARRVRVHKWSFQAVVRYALRYGASYATAGDIKGSAVWIPPGEYPLSLTRLLLAGWIMAPLVIGANGFGRFMQVANLFDRLHKRDMSAPHWYLMILGVDPDYQGRGIGGELMQPVLTRADGAGMPCYLETEREVNVPFYKKHGFEVLVEHDIPAGGPRFWTMKREPRG